MRLLMLACLVTATPAAAATPAAMAEGLSDARAACRKASGFKNAATLGTPVMFSDTPGQTAVLVTGVWRPKHMKNARGTMLCLYDRAAKVAEVQEAKAWSAPRN